MRQRAALLAAWLPAISIGIALGAALVRHGARLDHDCAMYMACAARLMGGARPYLDLVEVNPPLAWVIYGAPEVAARLLAPLGISAPRAFHLVVALYGALGLGIMWPLLERVQRPAFVVAWLLVHLVAVVVPFHLYWVDYWVSLPLAQWGQREHLFFVAAVAWLAVRAARDSGVAVGDARAGTVGALAGVMASLKPHFLVSLVGVEIVCRLWGRAGGRSVSQDECCKPELVTFAAVPVLYLGQFLLWPAEWRRELIRWIARIAEGYDHAYGSSWGHLAAHAWPSAAALCAVFGVRVAVRRTQSGAGSGAETVGEHPLVLRVLVLSTFGFVMAILQRKGFPYHFFPTEAGAVLGAGLLVAARGVDVWVRRAAAALGVGVAGVCLILPPYELAPGLTESLDAAIDRAGLLTGDRVMAFGDAVLGPWPTLRLRGLVPAGRFPWFFPLPLLQTLALGPARDAEEARLADEVAQDITREPPAAIFLQIGTTQAFPIGFDLQQWFLRFPSTERALANFEPTAPRGSWRAYLRKQKR